MNSKRSLIRTIYLGDSWNSITLLSDLTHAQKNSHMKGSVAWTDPHASLLFGLRESVHKVNSTLFSAPGFWLIELPCIICPLLTFISKVVDQDGIINTAHILTFWCRITGMTWQRRALPVLQLFGTLSLHFDTRILKRQTKRRAGMMI